MTRHRHESGAPIWLALGALFFIFTITVLILTHPRPHVLTGTIADHTLTLTSDKCEDPKVLHMIELFTMMGAIEPNASFKSGTDNGGPICWTDIDQYKIGVVSATGETGWVPRHIFNSSIPMPPDEGASQDGNI